MKRVRRSARLWRGSIALGFAALGLAPAAAQEYCVACTEPNAIYRCVIEQAVPTGSPLKMLCIGTLAREGGHATCAVRSGTVFDCDGPVRRVDARTASGSLGGAKSKPPITDEPAAQAAPAAPVNADLAPRQRSSAPAAKPANATPRTVEEVAREMSKSSGEALGKAGDAIAGSTRKAWGCVASFFKSC
jgi:hypothetical protein